MADAELTAKVKVDNEVPQAMDKAKAATVSFGKQVEDIQKKFSTAFKDIFLAYTAPMVIIQNTIGLISDSIAKAKQDAKDAIAFAAKGESKYLSSGTVASAREVTARQQDALDRKNAQLAREALAEEQSKQGGFIGFGGEADKALVQYVQEGKGFMDKAGRSINAAAIFFGINSMSKDNAMQDVLERRAIDRTPYQPDVEGNKLKAAQDAKDIAELKQFAGRSKPGEVGGFGNVIGVGSNIAIEMAQMQIDELKRHTELLQMIATKEQQATDFSKGDKSVAAPSRAKLLSGK